MTDAITDKPDLSRATPRPWRVEQSWRPPIGKHIGSDTDNHGNVFWGYSIHGCNEHGAWVLPTLGAVHNFPDAIHANAALIVEAVNNYDRLQRMNAALVGALRRVVEELNDVTEASYGNAVATLARADASAEAAMTGRDDER